MKLILTFSNTTKSGKFDLYKIDENDKQVVGSIYLPVKKNPAETLTLIIKKVKA